MNLSTTHVRAGFEGNSFTGDSYTSSSTSFFSSSLCRGVPRQTVHAPVLQAVLSSQQIGTTVEEVEILSQSSCSFPASIFLYSSRNSSAISHFEHQEGALRTHRLRPWRSLLLDGNLSLIKATKSHLQQKQI